MNFQYEKDKLKKIDNSVKSNNNSKERKNKNIISFDEIDLSINIPKVIHETDWISQEVSSMASSTVIKKLWGSSTVEFREEISISEELLPYLDIDLLIEPPLDGEVVVWEPVTSVNSGSRAIVTGNGVTLYNGQTSFVSPAILSESTFSQYGIPLSHGTRAWFHTLSYIPVGGGDQQNIIQPIIEIRAEIDLGGDNKDVYDIFVTNDRAHTINTLTTSGFSGVGDKNEIREEGGAFIPDTPISLSFSAISRYRIWYRNGTFLDFKDAVGGGVTIISQSFELGGRYVFYTPNSLAGPSLTSDGSGGFRINVFPNDDPIYSNIRLEVKSFDLPGTETTTFTSNINQRKRFSYFKIKDNLYNILFRVPVNFEVMANKGNDLEINTKTYTQDGSSYSLSTEENTTGESTFLFGFTENFRYKVRLVLKPPLNWKEKRKYNEL